MKNFDLYHEKIGTWDDEKKMYFQVDEYDDMIFYSKRPDARFRSNINKSAWHNEANRRDRRSQSAVNASMRRNWMILKKLFPESQGRIPIPKKRLVDMGFSDKAPSNTELVLRTGQIIFYYYDFGIQTTDDKQIVTIHKKQNDGNDPSKLI